MLTEQPDVKNSNIAKASVKIYIGFKGDAFSKIALQTLPSPG